jgi:hypothetical protein
MIKFEQKRLKHKVNYYGLRSINILSLFAIRKMFLMQWNDIIIVSISKEEGKTDCSNYRGISLLSTLHKIVFNIIVDHQCGF